MAGYLNARAALHGELFSQVSEALGGESVLLWVPGAGVLGREERDREIVRLREEGNTAAEIADRLFMAERTVWRMLAAARNAERSVSETDRRSV